MSFNTDELVREIDERLETMLKELMEERLRVLQLPESNEKLKDLVSKTSTAIRIPLQDQMAAYVQNEIGNRLRCGVYDGLKMDALFERVWTRELDRAIEDRIRKQVIKVVENLVRGLLEKVGKTIGEHPR